MKTAALLHGGKQKRRERLLEASDARLLILHMLTTRHAHGYELIKAIEEISGGEYSPSPSLIYPNLTLLDEMGLIAVVDGDGEKKAWRLTEAGEQALTAQQKKLAAVIARLETLAILVANRSIPAVEQAIHQMKSALHQQLARADLSPEALENIVQALNHAAAEIAAAERR